MTAMDYSAFKSYLKDLNPEQAKAIYLIYGQEMLCRSVVQELIQALAPESDREFTCEYLEGEHDRVVEGVQKLRTFSMLPGPKLVILQDPEIFQGRRDPSQFLKKAKDAFEKEDMTRAAGYLARALALQGRVFEDLSPGQGEKIFDSADLAEDESWVETLAAYAVSHNITAPRTGDTAGLLERVIEKGFPQGNHLILVLQSVEKRSALFQAIEEKGMVIDCSVPAGERKADRKIQDAVLHQQMSERLQKSGKQMTREAYDALFDMTGFDPRNFFNNLDKLIDFTGERKRITGADVQSVLSRTRQDPIYALTGAVAERKLADSLALVDSLLKTGLHPLQILSALINQVRKLLLIRDFSERNPQVRQLRDQSFPVFNSQVAPLMESYDQMLSDRLNHWQEAQEKSANVSESKPRRRRQPASDLFIVKNSKSTYPVYSLWRLSYNFSRADLLAAVDCLAEADYQLKSSGQAPKIILEHALMRICMPAGGKDEG